jgi:cysteine desulfurase
MTPFWEDVYGNPASWHTFGSDASKAVEGARESIAACIGAEAKSIVFTSGATESVNLALEGAREFYRDNGNHLVTTRTEHPAVFDRCGALEKNGCDLTVLPVDKFGRVDPEAIQEAITEKTILISVIHANNEIGTLNDVEAIGAIAKERGVLFHCDAAQSLGKTHLDVEAMGIDLLSLSAHKTYGPKGVGALYCRRRNPRVRLNPILYGGGHERGFRSGTLNVPGIVGFAKACEIALQEKEEETTRVGALRDLLEKEITSALEGVTRNGHHTETLPGNLNLSFSAVDGMELLRNLPEIALSLGSACTSAIPAPSRVLRAIGVTAELAASSLRFGVGRFNTEDEIRDAANRVTDVVRKLRESASVEDDLDEADDSCLLGAKV